MLYIHNLKDLSPKTADIEIIPMIRDIKRSHSTPLSEQKLVDKFSLSFVSQGDLDVMSEALSFIQPTIQEIVELGKTKGSYEVLNLKRACSVLEEVPVPLRANIEYTKEIFKTQELFVAQINVFLNKQNSFKNEEEKKVYNDKINQIFEKLLRNNEEFKLKHDDIIYEAQLGRVAALAKGMKEGFFFHVDIEEHLKGEDFSELSKRIPAEEIEKVNLLTKKIETIANGVERAYENNMRMINFALLLYAYIKWIG